MRHQNIKSERVRLGMSAEELARELGVSVSTVTKWETETATPNGANLRKLAGVFSCSTDYLLDITDDRLQRRF